MNSERRQARESAVQMLTAADINPPEDLEAFMAAYWEQRATLGDGDGADGKASARYRRFAEERVRGVLANLREIDGILGPSLENWDLYRLGTIERAVLRLGVWEMKYAAVPGPVVINEAVDIANWYSSAKTRAIVNGVLSRVKRGFEC